MRERVVGNVEVVEPLPFIVLVLSWMASNALLDAMGIFTSFPQRGTNTGDLEIGVVVSPEHEDCTEGR